MRRLFAVAVVVFGFLPAMADAGTFIVYLHGRSDQSWGWGLAKVPGWTNVTVAYDGNARLGDPQISARIESTLERYCSGANTCMVTCHSAGCMRTLLAVDTLSAKGKPLNLLWVEASASAAGGSRLAELTTHLFGDEPIDEDIRRDRARAGTGWAHIQDAMTSATMYHSAGRKDSCQWFVCGNWFLPAGTCDGLVCMDSAGGASTAGTFTDGCRMPLYPGRVYDTARAACTGAEQNHSQMANYAVQGVEKDLKAGRGKPASTNTAAAAP